MISLFSAFKLCADSKSLRQAMSIKELTNGKN
mgnify:CR=1 FL=1